MINKIKAIGLLSGGLDSTLAVKIIQGQGIEVTGINFYTGFCITEHRRNMTRRDKSRAQGHPALQAAAGLGIKVELIDISSQYLDILFHPKHGYGSAVNPCLDCRIFMLKKAREFMKEAGAGFVFTGEVLGQRPMSQYLKALKMVEEESGLDGFLLRPLSAKLLPITVPEEKGWVKREMLYGIEGRSRKEQIILAEELGVKEYPQPAGGCCFLTDKNYGRRLHDLVKFKGKAVLTWDDLHLLKLGRHFRLSPGLKVIIGRDEEENKFLERYKNGKSIFRILSHPGPTALADGEVRDDDIKTISALVAGYSDGKSAGVVEVEVEKDGEQKVLSTAILDKSLVEQLTI